MQPPPIVVQVYVPVPISTPVACSVLTAPNPAAAVVARLVVGQPGVPVQSPVVVGHSPAPTPVLALSQLKLVTLKPVQSQLRHQHLPETQLQTQVQSLVTGALGAPVPLLVVEERAVAAITVVIPRPKPVTPKPVPVQSVHGAVVQQPVASASKLDRTRVKLAASKVVPVTLVLQPVPVP